MWRGLDAAPSCWARHFGQLFGEKAGFLQETVIQKLSQTGAEKKMWRHREGERERKRARERGRDKYRNVQRERERESGDLRHR